MSFSHHRIDRFDAFDSFFACPISSSTHYFHRESSFPFDPFTPDLDLFVPPPRHFESLSSCPYIDSAPSLDLLDISSRVTALELGARQQRPAFGTDRKYTYKTEIKGDRKYKWISEAKSSGEKNYRYEAEIRSPHKDGFDRKYKWTADSDGCVKWTKEIKGRGCNEALTHSYTCEESLGEDLKKEKKEKKLVGKKEEKKEKKNEKKNCPVRVVEIEDSTPATIAIRKAYHKSCMKEKGKRKELSPQDAAILIQENYRAHLARRSQVLRCLREMAVAKAKLKEIRTLFYNFSYRRRVACDSLERQRFSEKIVVLLLTVDAIEVF